VLANDSAAPPLPDTPLGACCATCFYWQSERPPWGRCRRYPPILVMLPEGLRARFPNTAGGWFCGEHATVREPGP
jgi:hypothetical protein